MAKIDPNEPCPCGSGRIFADCHGPLVIVDRLPEITERVALKVIPEPDPNTRSVLGKIGDGTIMMHGQDTGIALCCGACGEPLIVGLRIGQVQNIVLKCNGCGAHNDTIFAPPSDPHSQPGPKR